MYVVCLLPSVVVVGFGRRVFGGCPWLGVPFPGDTLLLVQRLVEQQHGGASLLLLLLNGPVTLDRSEQLNLSSSDRWLGSWWR